MAFELSKLPYSYSAFEPLIDTETMETHHSKHHQTYVNNANASVADSSFSGKTAEELLISLQDIPENIRNAVRNHVGGHYNHSVLWETIYPRTECISPASNGTLLSAIEKTFTNFSNLKENLCKTAISQFGSGWGWLSWDSSASELVIESTSNQDSPLSCGRYPLVGIDVWEHAYYLKYKNRRDLYVLDFFEAINWRAVEEKLLGCITTSTKSS